MKEMSKSKYHIVEILRIISKKSVSSVMNERYLLSNLNHPYFVGMKYFSLIVNMKTAFQDRENLYLIMDLL